MNKKPLEGGKRAPLRSINVCVLLMCLLASSVTFAADGPGSTGALYLRMPVSARSIAMGEASTGLRSDPFGWLANPGITGPEVRTGAGIFHSQWLMDTYYDNITLNRRAGGIFDLRLALTYMSAPEVQGFDGSGIPTSSLDNSNFQGILGLGASPLPNVGIGINLKYFQETIADWTASGFGVDAGATVGIPVPDITLGISVRNVGPKIKFISHEEELPLTVAVGGAVTRPLLPGLLGWTLAVDAVIPSHEETYAAVGTALTIRDVFTLRAGFNGEKDRADSGLTAGGGINLMGRAWLDYAWTPYGDLGDFHRVSIYFSLGGP